MTDEERAVRIATKLGLSVLQMEEIERHLQAVREECAKVCEELVGDDESLNGWPQGCRECAKAIREG